MRPKLMMISLHGDPMAELGGIQAGGQNVYVKQLSLALEEMDWEVDVFTHWDDPDKPGVERLGSRSFVRRIAAGHKGFIPKEKLHEHVRPFAGEIVELAEGKRHEYALIHSNYWLSGWAGRILKRALDLPQVHTSHSLGAVRARAIHPAGSTAYDDPVLGKRLAEEKAILASAEVVIATSTEERDQIVNQYGVRGDNIRVVPCGVDTTLFTPGDRRRERERLKAEGKSIVLFVGRFESNKGLHVLIDSLRLLRERNPGLVERVELWVIGGSRNPHMEKEVRYRNEIQKRIAEAGLSDRVKFWGPASHDRLVRYYRAADVTVIPSYYESFGLVAIEAMAAGCPVIASAVGGLKCNVRHGETGFLVPPRDTRSLATALETMLSNCPLREEMSGKATRFAASRFQWVTIATRIAEIYAEVSGCHRRGTIPARTGSSPLRRT